jgi:phosphonate transport system permease protein
MIPANPMTRFDGVGDDPSPQLSHFAERFVAERRAMRLRSALFGVVFLIALVGSAMVSEFNPAQLAAGLPDAWNYIWSTFPSLHLSTMGSDLHEWYWNLPRLLELLAETVLMSFVATVLGSIAALLLCFSASRNLVRGHVAYFLTCRILELARTVPDLVYAMIFVFALGIGPLPGVLALAVHTTGALGKLFSEVNEAIDRRPLDGVVAAGGTWPVIMRIAVLPQVLPNFVSYALLRFEFNIRSASVLGIVGAGGIGEELYLSIRQFDYTDISAIVLLIIVVVMLADLACESVRHRLIGKALFAEPLA